MGLQFLVSCYAAPSGDPDTLTYEEAMRATDADKFKESAFKELDDLIKQGTWSVVDKSEAKTKILPGIWTFRRKRNPGTGEISKYKGRYSVRGDLQEGKFDTLAPVVPCSTVRLTMTMGLGYG